MECNRDEAIRAKTIAEKKIDDKDFAGAKKFTLKAQTLYPGLDGIAQMLITIDVYISSENKVNGESDWYQVLDVTPSDDDETMRKRYRKLALSLHPDKNKSVGADGAFKILSEAWSMLSDKDKRSAYNQRRNLRVFQQKVASQSAYPSTDHGFNGFHSFPNRAPSKPKSRKSTTSKQTHSAKVPSKVPPKAQAQAQARAPEAHQSATFWTICNLCNMNHEYPKAYLNQTLLCHDCHKAFHATEIPKPKDIPKPAHPSGHQWHPNSSNHVQATGKVPSGRSSCHNKKTHRSSRTKVNPSVASKVADLVQQFHDRLRRDTEDFINQRLSKRRKEEDGGQSSTGKNPY